MDLFPKTPGSAHFAVRGLFSLFVRLRCCAEDIFPKLWSILKTPQSSGVWSAKLEFEFWTVLNMLKCSSNLLSQNRYPTIVVYYYRTKCVGKNPFVTPSVLWKRFLCLFLSILSFDLHWWFANHSNIDFDRDTCLLWLSSAKIEGTSPTTVVYS